MKKTFLNLPIMLVAILALVFSSCKKDGTTATTEDNSISAADVASVSSGLDETNEDAGAVVGGVRSYPGPRSDFFNRYILCGSVTVDTGTPGDRLITITYDGSTTCNGMERSGSITIANNSGIPWNQQNSVITVTYNNLKLTDVMTGAYYTINGMHTITNETGGLAWQVIAQLVPSGTTVTHRNVSSDMSITFANGEKRTWTVDRSRTWNLTGQLITKTVFAQGANNVTESGTNRYGHDFTNQISAAIMSNNQAGCVWDPYQGGFSHVVNTTSTQSEQITDRTTSVVFGTNPEGVQIGSATTCGDGYFITYTNSSGQTKTKFVGYWHF